MIGVYSLWFMVHGLGFRMAGSGFGVEGRGFRIQGSAGGKWYHGGDGVLVPPDLVELGHESVVLVVVPALQDRLRKRCDQQIIYICVYLCIYRYEYTTLSYYLFIYTFIDR